MVIPSVAVLIRREPEGRDLPLPRYMTPYSSGMDLLAACEGEIVLGPGERAAVSAGISIALPEGYEAQIRPRSGLALKHGLTLLNSPGTIDSDYRGPIKVIVINHGKEDFVIRRGERIAQMIVQEVRRAEWRETAELPPTLRDTGGFGHTGR